MDAAMDREAEETRIPGTANGVSTKFRRALDGGGGASGYYRPAGRLPGGEGGYHRPAGRVLGGEGGYYRPLGRLAGGDGRMRSHLHRRSFGRRFERKPGDGPLNGFARNRWKPRPPGRECPSGGTATRPRDCSGGESPPSPEEGEGSAGADEEQEEESWTLFKPPANFPVHSSSARTVPRISYASKVKENLSPEAAGGGAGENATQAAPRLGPALGAIFRNQWGLSFITEPGQAGLNPGQPPDPGIPAAPHCTPANRLSPGCEHWTDPVPLDLQDIVLYFSTEWDRIWERHKREPSSVVLYEESLDTAALTD